MGRPLHFLGKSWYATAYINIHPRNTFSNLLKMVGCTRTITGRFCLFAAEHLPRSPTESQQAIDLRGYSETSRHALRADACTAVGFGDSALGQSCHLGGFENVTGARAARLVDWYGSEHTVVGPPFVVVCVKREIYRVR